MRRKGQRKKNKEALQIYRHGTGVKPQFHRREVSKKVLLSVRTGFVTVALTSVWNKSLTINSALKSDC